MDIQVLKAITQEREYQGLRWGHKGNKPTEAYIAYLSHYLTEAQRAISKEDGPEPALHVIRKITALGVACMEDNGAPLRPVVELERLRGTAPR